MDDAQLPLQCNGVTLQLPRSVTNTQLKYVTDMHNRLLCLRICVKGMCSLRKVYLKVPC